MSLQTVEVELENGVVRPCGGDTLPVKARALLTIMKSPEPAVLQVPEKATSLAERVQHLCGIGDGTFTDLSTNKAHMEGFGK